MSRPSQEPSSPPVAAQIPAWQIGMESLAQTALPHFLPHQRWYPAKDAAALPQVSLTALLPFPTAGMPAAAAVWRVAPPGRIPFKMFIPIALVPARQADPVQAIAPMAGAHGEELWIVEAFSQDAFVHAWMDSLLRDGGPRGETAAITSGRTSRLKQCDLTQAPSWSIRRSRAEQSNTSIRIGEEAILKVIRKLEDGPHPELEIARYLNGASFTATPPLLGWTQWEGPTGSATLSILQGFVANQGDGWSWVLERLERPPAWQETLDWIARLGRRTAEMHLAFGVGSQDPAFRPEPVTPQDVGGWKDAAHTMARTALDRLASRTGSLAGETAALARRLLEQRGAIAHQLETALDVPLDFARTRHHGDYHLGQVLVRDGDAAIIDFEGEPLRPLAERRAKNAVLRDVAGMLRSFAYAAATAGHQGVDAAAWRRQAEQAFLDSYLRHGAAAAGCPRDRGTARRIIRFFMLEKALYEIAYELANRPDWLDIPLRGALELLETGDS